MSIDESSLLLGRVQRRQQGGSVDVRRTGDFDDQVRRDSQMARERMPELVGQWVRDDQIDVVSRQPEIGDAHGWLEALHQPVAVLGDAAAHDHVEILGLVRRRAQAVDCGGGGE